MTVNVLEHGMTYAILGGDGKGFRIVDRPKKCHGYQNGCHCKGCLVREARKLKRPAISRCECDRPLWDTATGNCIKCGHVVMPAAA